MAASQPWRNVNVAPTGGDEKMTKRLLVVFALLGLAVASAKQYSLTLFQPSVLGSTELKAGDYKVEVTGDKVVIKGGREVSEAPVKVETGNEKYRSTSVRYANGDGKYKIQEIRLGGTNMKLIVNN
jgi:hypothetical protein